MSRNLTRRVSTARNGLLCIWAVTFGQLSLCEAAEPPNIILIVTDDQGWGDLSCHGNPAINTPHLDAMAERSGRLARFYVSPVCSPTRACLMTGRYNHRTRVIDTFKGHSMMEPDEVTVAEMLRTSGYATGIFGKWHLGDCYPMRPQDQGFDAAVVFRGGGLAQPSEPLENNRRYTNPLLWRNGEQFEARGYCTDVYFHEAIRFIEDRTAADQPFFALVATNAPHSPYHDVPDELYRKYKNEDLTPVLLGDQNSADTVARIFAMVENIDDNVGRLFASLDRLEIADNTLVVFMCDNGPNTRRHVGRRRGMKSEVYEGGITSPFFAHWPARIPAGTVSDRVAAHIDVLPTFLAAAGVEPPAGLKLDGRDLLPLLTGHQIDWPDRTLVLQAHRGSQPVAGHNVAVVGQRWKLVRPSGFQFTAPAKDTPYELYDLAADPNESRNRIDDEPDVARDLRAAYDRWFADVSSTRPDNYAPPRIVVGTEHEIETALTRQDWQATGSGWGEQGEWLIRVAEPATFMVTVLLESAATGEAALRLGGMERHQQVTELSRHVVFETVAIAKGELAVRFELVNGDSVIPPYQLVLKRQ